MNIKLFDKKCILTKGYIQDAGWDLKTTKRTQLVPFETKTINVGVAIELPYGTSGDIRPRSSISKRGILCHYGTVDEGYTGEIKVVLTNLTQQTVTLEKHEKIAQLVINKIFNENEIRVVKELDESSRGGNGFGSTGRF